MFKLERYIRGDGEKTLSAEKEKPEVAVKAVSEGAQRYVWLSRASGKTSGSRVVKIACVRQLKGPGSSHKDCKVFVKLRIPKESIVA